MCRVYKNTSVISTISSFIVTLIRSNAIFNPGNYERHFSFFSLSFLALLFSLFPPSLSLSFISLIYFYLHLANVAAGIIIKYLLNLSLFLFALFSLSLFTFYLMWHWQRFGLTVTPNLRWFLFIAVIPVNSKKRKTRAKSITRSSCRRWLSIRGLLHVS